MCAFANISLFSYPGLAYGREAHSLQNGISVCLVLCTERLQLLLISVITVYRTAQMCWQLYEIHVLRRVGQRLT